jgi:hypothetical protein
MLRKSSVKRTRSKQLEKYKRNPIGTDASDSSPSISDDEDGQTVSMLGELDFLSSRSSLLVVRYGILNILFVLL